MQLLIFDSIQSVQKTTKLYVVGGSLELKSPMCMSRGGLQAVASLYHLDSQGPSLTTSWADLLCGCCMAKRDFSKALKHQNICLLTKVFEGRHWGHWCPIQTRSGCLHNCLSPRQRSSFECEIARSSLSTESVHPFKGQCLSPLNREDSNIILDCCGGLGCYNCDVESDFQLCWRRDPQ